MTPSTKIVFGIAALTVLSVVGWLCFLDRPASLEPAPAAIVAPAPVEPPQPPAVATQPPAPSPEATAAIPWNELTRVAAARNEIIYTTSKMGEPMEVHPDGTVVIHDHRKVFTFADGRQEVRYARITAKPSWIPLSGVRMPEEDLAPPK